MNKTVAWLLLLSVWVCTAFVNDRLGTPLTVGYVALTAVAVIYGVVTGARDKSWPLVVAAILTAFAWPILLFGVLALFGISS